MGGNVKRESNFELLRITGMFMIVTHHYVVNFGIIDNFAIGNTSLNYIFLLLFGMWGKTGINIFIMISGYFMCKSDLTIQRYCKVFSEFLFYHFIIYFLMLFKGYEIVSFNRIFDLFFGIFKYANASGSFISSFFIFYLFIPFINKFIQNLTKQEYKHFILLLLFVFTILSTFFSNIFIFGEVFWFIAVYFIGGYLRLYPPLWANSLKASGILLIVSLILSYISVVVMVFIRPFLKDISIFYFVIDANKIGAVLVGIFMFTTFKNINIQYSKIINLIAKTVFGILMLHANSDAWRQFMWRDLLHVDTSYSLPLMVLISRSIIISAGIFIVCSIIDVLRIYFIEKPIFNNFDRIETVIIKIWSIFKKTCYNIYNSIVIAVE